MSSLTASPATTPKILTKSADKGFVPKPCGRLQEKGNTTNTGLLSTSGNKRCKMTPGTACELAEIEKGK